MSDDDVPDSGPFCAHWDDPCACTEPCLSCRHECRRHGTRYEEGCAEEGCGCEAFVSEEI